jgi:hypothetical protein
VIRHRHIESVTLGESRRGFRLGGTTHDNTERPSRFLAQCDGATNAPRRGGNRGGILGVDLHPLNDFEGANIASKVGDALTIIGFRAFRTDRLTT